MNTAKGVDILCFHAFHACLLFICELHKHGSKVGPADDMLPALSMLLGRKTDRRLLKRSSLIKWRLDMALIFSSACALS